MTNSDDRLIETAVRSFDDNAEMKLSASMLLEELACGDRAGEDQMIGRWEVVDGRKRGMKWRMILYVALLIVSVVLLFDAAKIVIGYENMISVSRGSQFVDFFHNSPKVTEQEIAARLTRDEVLLLFGDLSKHSAADRVKALWDSEPENPAYFADYVNAYIGETGGKLPPDFLKIARRIDPENAWFTYVAAAVGAKDAVKQRPQSKSAKSANATPEWDILDPAALNDSLALLRDARNQPKCETYQNELGRARVKLLPTDTPAEVTFALGYRFGTSQAAEIAMKRLGDAAAAKAWLCGEENDIASFGQLLADVDGFLRKRTEGEIDSTLGEIMTGVFGNAFISNASPSAEKLGFPDEAKKLAASLKILNQRKVEFQKRKANPNADLLYQHGGGLASITGIYSKLQNPPPLTLEDLKPGRLMDHETVAWTLSYFVWALLVLGMGVAAASRFGSAVLIRRLSARVQVLMLPRDWLAVFGVGVMVPILYFVTITRFTPLGGRELSVSMDYGSFHVPYFDDPLLGVVQSIALVLLIVFSAGAVACGCLRTRAKSLGLVTASSATLLIPIASLMAFIPLSGWAVVYSSGAAVVIAWVLVGIPLTWGIFIASQTLFGHPRTQLRYGMVARVLIPSCALAALLALSAAPFLKMRAYYWSSKDMLVRSGSDFPTGSEFEHRIALQMRKELRETLGYDR